MSQVKDSEGNVVNRHADQFYDGAGNLKYSGKDMTTLDWFDTHPEDKPSLTKIVVEDGEPTVVPDAKANAVVETLSAGLLPSADDLDAVVKEQEIAQVSSDTAQSSGEISDVSSDNGVQSQ